MRTITLQGLRGGVGTTSITAMLGDALHRQGQHVLLVDLNPADILRLFFNVSHQEPYGWAGALSRQQAWYEHAYRVAPYLDLLAYGRRGLDTSSTHSAVSEERAAAFWLESIPLLRHAYDWLIIDLPAASTHFSRLQQESDLDLCIASVDAACHVLLAQTTLRPECHIVPSLFDPSKTLANDILLEWRYEYARHMIPVPVHRDEAVHEALASKTTVNMLYPESMGASDARSLATWIMAKTNASV